MDKTFQEELREALVFHAKEIVRWWESDAENDIDAVNNPTIASIQKLVEELIGDSEPENVGLSQLSPELNGPTGAKSDAVQKGEQ